MRNKLLALLLSIALLCPVLTAGAQPAEHSYTVTEVQSLCDGIASFNMVRCSASSTQGWLDSVLCDNAGVSSEFYVITLSQSGNYDFTKYRKALLSYLDSHEVYSPVTREKYALALAAAGGGDSYIQEVCDSDIGGMGLMSLVFGLHLLNNGYSSALYTADSLIYEILSCQLDDGGWAVIGSAGDVDVTAMTIQALAPHRGRLSSAKSAIDSALELLSARQLDSGSFVSMGCENCESAAQVLTALSSLRIDQNTDERFIKNGNTVLDGMLCFRNSDGSFAHTGSGFNENATIQAYYSLTAYLRMLRGQGPYYILDDHTAPTDEPELEPTEAVQNGADSQSSTESPTEQETATQAVSEPTSAPLTEPYHGDYIAPTGEHVFQPTGTADNTANVGEAAAGKDGYKLWAILAVLASALIACGVLFLLKKRGCKNYIAVAIIAALLIVIILLTNFETVESYRTLGDKGSATGEVTLSIRCDTIAGEDDKPMTIPEDGVILDEAVFTISESSTVYDILLEASKTYGIQIDDRGSENSAYIAGIQYLYEFDYGSMSGWMYRVNGEFPETGCRAYRLSDGDSIEWLYTTNIGKDL